MDRRQFLTRAAAAVATLPTYTPRMAFAPQHSGPRGDVLVCVFLRGAADVLNMVVPHGEAAYYRERPTLAIARPDDLHASATLRAHDLDGFFGLHPALTPLLPSWQAKDLAIVQACGAPDESRSHFQAMELMERGVETQSGPASGWIGRHLAALDTGNASPLRALGLGEQVQRALYGSIPATALRSIVDFHFGGALPAGHRLQQALGRLYHDDPQLAAVAQGTLDVAETLHKLDPLGYRSANGALYPESDFGMGLRQIAMLVKAEVGLEVACIDLDGWDTHFAQGGSEGLMAGLLDDLARGLAAFYADMHAHKDRLSVVVMSEFGRRLRENGALGTDHGHGSMMLLLGGSVVGGTIHGNWPGLEAGQLVGSGDLAVTTDYRDVLGELLAQRLNNPLLESVFPGYTPTFRGVTRKG
jgi:uncharacterized protein (DUF1501 family)